MIILIYYYLYTYKKRKIMDQRACDVSDGRMMNVSDDLITTAYCVLE